MKKITVILPCAGSGTRLGLSCPKELYLIYDNFRLIDFSLNHILEFKKNNPAADIRIVVVTLPSKTAVTDYMRTRVSGAEIIQVFFNDKYHEWAGSVYSAAKHFGEHNIVLLPDSALRLSLDNVYYDNEGRTLIEIMSGLLDESAAAFGYKTCNDGEILVRLGALYVYGGKIYLFQDKPEENVSNYNAFWTAYAFRKDCAESLYRFLSGSIMHQNPCYDAQPFYPASAVETADYHDLGTWESINDFLKNENREDYIRL